MPLDLQLLQRLLKYDAFYTHVCTACGLNITGVSVKDHGQNVSLL